jgi:hypothetical protein
MAVTSSCPHAQGRELCSYVCKKKKKGWTPYPLRSRRQNTRYSLCFRSVQPLPVCTIYAVLLYLHKTCAVTTVVCPSAAPVFYLPITVRYRNSRSCHGDWFNAGSLSLRSDGLDNPRSTRLSPSPGPTTPCDDAVRPRSTSGRSSSSSSPGSTSVPFPALRRIRLA